MRKSETPPAPESTEAIVLCDGVFDKLLDEYYNLLWLYNGKVCKTCNIIQGSIHKGVYPYFCRHVSNNVQRRLKGTELDRMCTNYLYNKAKSLTARTLP